MSEKKLGRIKVFIKNDPKKGIVAYLKDLSIDETLDKIRESLKKNKKKIDENYVFVDKENDDNICKDLENDATVEDVLINENGQLKIYLSIDNENPNEHDAEQKNDIISNDTPNFEQKESNEEIKNKINNKNDCVTQNQEENINIQINNKNLKNEVLINNNDIQNNSNNNENNSLDKENNSIINITQNQICDTQNLEKNIENKISKEPEEVNNTPQNNEKEKPKIEDNIKIHEENHIIKNEEKSETQNNPNLEQIQNSNKEQITSEIKNNFDITKKLEKEELISKTNEIPTSQRNQENIK